MPPKKKIEFDPSPGAPFAAEPGWEVPAGLAVVRGPGWSFGDQDGGEADAIGLVDGWSSKTPGNVRVRWPNGKVCSYPPDGKTLIVAPEDAVRRNAERDELRTGPRAPKLRNGESLLGLVFVPGPDWRGPGLEAGSMLVPCAWVGSEARIEVRAPDGTKSIVRVGHEGRYDVLLPTDEQFAAWKEERAAALKALKTKFFRWIRSGDVWTRCFSWFERPGPMRLALAQARIGIDASAPDWKLPEDGDFETIQRLLAARLTEMCASEADAGSASAGELLARVVSKNPGNRNWADFLSGKNSGECDARVPAIGESRPPARAAAGAATAPVEVTLFLRRTVQENVTAHVSGNIPLDLAHLRARWDDDGVEALNDMLRDEVARMVETGAYVRIEDSLARVRGTERVVEEVREDWSIDSIGGDGESLGEFTESLESRFEEERDDDDNE
jgi:hypothetical protein